MVGKTLEQEREKLNRINLDDPRVLEQSRKVDRLLLEVMRKQKPDNRKGVDGMSGY